MAFPNRITLIEGMLLKAGLDLNGAPLTIGTLPKHIVYRKQVMRWVANGDKIDIQYRGETVTIPLKYVKLIKLDI